MSRHIPSNMSSLSFFFLFFSLPSLLYVSGLETSGSSNKLNLEITRPDPFSPKASLIRYWNTHISNGLPKPDFFFSKASPLTAVDSSRLVQLATLNSLSTAQLTDFCTSANLFCDENSSKDQVGEGQPDSRPRDANFRVYNSKGFASYGSRRVGGADSFKNYSDGSNTPNDSFKTYSKQSKNHGEGFASYAKDGNVAAANFTSYAAGATGGTGGFNSYNERVNVPNLRFASYDSDSNSHKMTFTGYATETNSGGESFVSYGKNAHVGPHEFVQYSKNANTIGSGFTGYSESGHSANDSFKGYGDSGNNPRNNFKSYGDNGKSGIDSFNSYRDGANVGEDSFSSYARNSAGGKVNFVNYGNTFNKGNDTFKDYGKGSAAKTKIAFKTYNMDRTFKNYAKNGVTFSDYRNQSGSGSTAGISVNKFVEQGKFFRESALKEGNIMMMPDIKDKLPKRSFLPRGVVSKLPFSTEKMGEIREIFHAPERVIADALTECEREPSRGETKRCVESAEDMVDFATSVLGRDVTVRTTENTDGSKGKVKIGKVRGINGGNVTKSVSCHQSLYPYLLYYCHSVPKVRVYDVDILDADRQVKINQGIAICHLDTSAWSPTHGAFVALGPAPGRIEVCHWIFENDMTWTIAN